MSFAQVTLIGNLGRDPELNYTPSGTAVCKFSIATSKKQGDKEPVTTWWNCAAFGKLGETINQYASKGSQLFVQGELSQREYTTRDGKPGHSLDVTVNTFTFTGTKKASDTPAPSDDPLGDLEDHPF